MRNLLFSSMSAAALAALAAPAAQAAVVQVRVEAEVEQTVDYRGPTPNYFDPNPFTDDPYPFWDDYLSFVNQVGVWDETQVPLTLDAPESAYYGWSSVGLLTGTFTFDDAALAQDLTGFTDPNGTVLGTSALSSSLRVTAGLDGTGPTVERELFATSTLLAAADLELGGAVGDVIAISLRLPQLDTNAAGETFTSFGPSLLLMGDQNWFDDAEGAIPDFDRIQQVLVLYEEDLFANIETDEAIYGLNVTGQAQRATFQSFGAADGSSEESPLLPDDGVLNEDGSTTFAFDLSEAGSDFVFVDPEIAVGYVYEVVGDAQITAIQAPSAMMVPDADGYLVELPDGTTFTLAPGEAVTLDAPVQSLTLTGIDPALMLDPLDNSTFVAGFIFTGTTEGASLTQTALVEDTDASPVPLPGAAPLLAAGLAGLGLVSRRRRARA